MIELKDRILGDGLSAAKDFASPRCYEVRTLKSDSLSIMMDLVIGFHTIYESMEYAIDPPIALAVQPVGFQYMMVSRSN